MYNSPWRKTPNTACFAACANDILNILCGSVAAQDSTLRSLGAFDKADAALKLIRGFQAYSTNVFDGAANSVVPEVAGHGSNPHAELCQQSNGESVNRRPNKEHSPSAIQGFGGALFSSRSEHLL